MLGLRTITSNFSVAPQLEPDDFAKLNALGFVTVINNRPDEEPGVTLTSHHARMMAEQVGLRFAHVPANSHDLFDVTLIEQMAATLKAQPGPVVAYCKSGTRSAILWALTEARHRSASRILADLAKADFELDVLRPELKAQAARICAQSATTASADAKIGTVHNYSGALQAS